MGKHYVMADIHGNFKGLKLMLEKINFSDDDTMTVIGDVLDRGPKPITALQFIMSKPNIDLLLGNHELMAMNVLHLFNENIDKYNYDSLVSKEQDSMLNFWQLCGAKTTIDEFMTLNNQQKSEVMDYLKSCQLVKNLEINGENYVLAHTEMPYLHNPNCQSHQINLENMRRINYKAPYVEGILISGHTPTAMIDGDFSNKIYKNEFHIAIDCGLKTLGCLCLDTMEEFYV